MIGEAFADAAAQLVGTPFRLHGRDSGLGLDCVGVVSAALAAIGRTPRLPDSYRLRTRIPDNLPELARSCGLIAAAPPIDPGDVAFVRIGSCQSHLLVAITSERFVHAHAGLRRVVFHNGPLAWPLVALWRLNNED